MEPSEGTSDAASDSLHGHDAMSYDDVGSSPVSPGVAEILKSGMDAQAGRGAKASTGHGNGTATAAANGAAEGGIGYGAASSRLAPFAAR